MSQSTTLTLRADASARPIAQVLGMVGFAALTAAAAQFEIPHYPVPYTLQTLVVLLSGAFLGKRNAALSQCMYLAAGMSGAPVFSHLGFGLAKILGPTGGYLLAFPVAAFVIGYLLEGKVNFFRSLVAMTFGLFVIFTLGTLQLYFVYFHNAGAAIANGFLIFSWWDGVKLLAAAGIASVKR
ncbi:MAG TPA: biotin transporter BioY [Bacteroidota bacterium]|nr:biotin transporter BioY [Bacteroidota bacterium]